MPHISDQFFIVFFFTATAWCYFAFFLLSLNTELVWLIVIVHYTKNTKIYNQATGVFSYSKWAVQP